MNIIFTICSANYLASAKTLQQSVLMHNPGNKFIYIIADKINNRIPLEFFEGVEFIEAENLEIPYFTEILNNYNLTEFNTAIKPFAIEYLHKKYNAEKFIFFDPDIIVFKNVDFIWDHLNTYDFIVTPHLLEPIVNEEFYHHQVAALNTGIFNFGFVAFNYSNNTEKIISWWKHHMINHGHSNSIIGEFYDQKIMNLLPIYTDKLLILKNPGCNVAGWNVHERTITKTNNGYLVNNTELIFYHYSGFIFDNSSNFISKHNNLKIENNKFIKEILDLYRNGLKQNQHETLVNLKCYYKLKPDIHRSNRFSIIIHKLSKLFN